MHDHRKQDGALYPSIRPRISGELDVGDGHRLYWEECGNPDGPVVVFLHGGPGAGCAPSHRRFFDPAHWRIVLFDQRGCGRSHPTASIEANTTAHIIDDIEVLRTELGIERWMVFGGSWGSLLALAYGIAYPQRCTGFVVRGIFLGHDEELRWFVEDMGRFFPDAHRAFLNALPQIEHDDPLTSYHRRLMDSDPAIHGPAARAWSAYENACARLLPVPTGNGGGSNDDGGYALPLSRIEAHYFVNKMFLPDGYILDNIERITHLPCIIVQGRYDVICPPWTASKLARTWPKANMVMVDDGGHSAFDPAIRRALVRANDDMRALID